jgi:hypothetical protein
LVLVNLIFHLLGFTLTRCDLVRNHVPSYKGAIEYYDSISTLYNKTWSYSCIYYQDQPRFIPCLKAGVFSREEDKKQRKAYAAWKRTQEGKGKLGLDEADMLLDLASDKIVELVVEYFEERKS